VNWTKPGTTRERTVGGLRTRYFPKSRISQGLVSVGPWVDIVFLLLFLGLLDMEFVLQPGVVVNLPETPFREGLRSQMIAVVLSVNGDQSAKREDIVFFDDERFLVDDAQQMGALKQAFSESARLHSESSLIIQADEKVSHGTIMRLLEMARDVGIRYANLASEETRE